MKVLAVVLIVLILVVFCYCIAGANRAFSTPEEQAREDDEQWEYLQSRKKIDKK